jgi:dephospho-CoA kinase
MDTQRTYIIGITGGIGSGKSTIARELATRGYTVYDCDREAKRIIATNSRVQQAIIDLLGAEAFCGTQYNTAYVAQRVFAEPALLQQLNAIVHPAVAQDILAVAQTDRERGALIVESAILYESGMDQLCDLVFWIDAPETIRLERTLSRDYQSQATEDNINKVRARMRSQQATTYIAQRTQKPIVLNNDGSRSISELADEICSYLN